MFFSVKPLLKEQAPKYDAGFIILKEIFLVIIKIVMPYVTPN
jgi:hypothetical protein